jgi:hypothetical protein
MIEAMCIDSNILIPLCKMSISFLDPRVEKVKKRFKSLKIKVSIASWFTDSKEVPSAVDRHSYPVNIYRQYFVPFETTGPCSDFTRCFL